MSTVSKLSVEFKNAPRSTSLAPCSASELLNRGETLSATHKVLTDNLGEENQRLPVGGPKAILPVFVINKNGEPLMPCKPAKARHLLKDSKAIVVSRSPFAIRLLWECEVNAQDITLGIDVGYSKIGFSAITEKQELISGDVTLRKDISKKLISKRQYRRTRRNRLWYREPRFNNRKRKDDWLAPSLEHKLQSHVRLVEQFKRILPISEVVVETSNFDTQKMQNPEISGVEYQQGELQGYEIREYLLEKWGRKCAYCGKINTPLETEHIVPKSRGGTDRVSNLTLACSECNLKKGNRTAKEFGYPEIQNKAKQPLKAIAFMNNVRWKLMNLLNCNWTYGYITKYRRIKFGLKKSHNNDAFIIADGNKQKRSSIFKVSQTRRNNRSIQMNRKGFKPSIRKQRYKLQPNDLVKYNGVLYRAKGVFSYGKWIRLVDSSRNIFNSNVKNVELIQYGKGLQFI